MKRKKNKLLLLFSAGVSLLGVFVAAVSTAAWFQINSQPVDTSLVTGSSNLTIDNIDGLKKEETIDPATGLPSTSSNITRRSAESEEVISTNVDMGTEDIAFDVPSGGLGYYLVKKNPAKTYKYVYPNDDNTYSWKFNEVNETNASYLSVTLDSISTNDSFIIRNYSYNSSQYKTINTKVEITKDNGNFNVIDGTYEIVPTVEGSYTIWLNKNTKKVTFEEELNFAELNTASRSKLLEPPKNSAGRASGATAQDKTVYLLYDSNLWAAGARIFLVEKNGSPEHWTEFTASGYRYNDVDIYKATANDVSSINKYCIYRRNPDNTGTWNSSNDFTDFGTTKNYLTFTGFSGYTINVSKSSFKDVIYDGWILIGKSGTGSSTFGTGNFAVADAIRLDSPSDPDNNLGQLQLTINTGDKFKVYYMMNGNTSTSNQWFGFDNLQVYNGTDNHSAISTYFQKDNNTDKNIQAKQQIVCTIYFTKENWWDHADRTDKWINVNITSSVVVKASKFNFEGTYQEVHDSNLAVHSVTLGSTVLVSTINGLSLSNTPTNYTRVGTDIYSDPDCAAGHKITTSFVANVNPKTVYMKFKENAITIYLRDFYVDYAGNSTGTVGSNIMTLDTQFGANTQVTAAALYSWWNGTYSDDLTSGGAKHTYSRIDNSSHNGAFVDGLVSDGTTIYVRYVRNSYDMVLTPSYFDPSGTHRLSFSIQETQTQNILDNNAFSTSKTFGNCEYKDHTNGIWYVFYRADSNWYSDQNCQNAYSGKPTSGAPLYAKMVAYPLTTFYIDADYAGWNTCNLYMWGSLAGITNTSALSDVVASKAIATDSGNKLFRVSMPTESIDGLLLQNGSLDGTNQTENIDTADMIDSVSKYLYIGSNNSNKRPASFKEYKVTTETNVWIEKKNGNTWEKKIQLNAGDGTGNEYIFESSYRLTNEDIIRIKDYNTSTVYGYSKYVTSNLEKHIYIGTADSGNAIQIKNLGVGKSARFNFYITHNSTPANRQLSIAMVPDLGNGYYIMNYNSTRGTENFIDAVKMVSNSDYSAYYNGFYADAGLKIFIKSYINAVDTIYTSFGSTTGVNYDSTTGIITFTATGYFDISVLNNSITITMYTRNEFFCLNRLDTSNASNPSSIESQQTALVLEVTFTCNNTYSNIITLEVINALSDWVGVALYVSDSKLSDSNAYDLVHTYRNNLSNSSTIVDQNNLVTTPGTNTYYAYILIDYLPVDYSSYNPGVNNLSFYLKATQPSV